MRINNQSQSVVFQRRLRSGKEIADYKKTVKQAKELIGQTGDSILIVHDTCLPQRKDFDIGVGNLASKKSLDFFEKMKTYLGINAVEILPQGPVKPDRGIYCAYSSSALPLANYVINPEFLLNGEFSSLITKEELTEVVKSNNSKDLICDYENVMGENSSYDKLLRKAFKRFEEKYSLENSKFKNFKKENSDWIEPFIKGREQTEKEFYYFKQFLADEHLKTARKELNKRGIRLIGDCQIGFPKEEVEIFKGAFDETKSIGWGLTALDYDTILNPNSPAYKLLKKKVQLTAKRYDGIRFDAAWAYVTPKLYNQNGSIEKKEMGDSILKLIDEWVKEIKGKDFDPNSLLYEFEADHRDFKAFNDRGHFISPLKDRKKIYTSRHLNDSWGTNHAFINMKNWSPDEFVIGVGNQDTQLLREMAEEIPEFKTRAVAKSTQIGPLSEILHIPYEAMKKPDEFAKAKMAETVTAKNNMVFYLDVFGRKDHFTIDDFTNKGAFARRLPSNFEDAYIKSLQEGFGFNIMDSFEKIFRSKDYDISHSDLYDKIVKYKNILLEEETNIKQNKKLIPHIALGIGIISLVLYSMSKLLKKQPKQIDTFEKLN